ncbi:MAG: M15 family metallopeptidase, partial [Pseudomonadota bacterium]
MTALLLIAAMLVANGAPSVAAPHNFVDITSVTDGAIMDIKYATADNFVGERIDGYEAAKCYLTPQTARALAAAQDKLETMKLRLRIFDCYRPQRAVDHFVRWAADLSDTKTKASYYPRVPKNELFEQGYIAEKSGHSRASTVDLTIDELDMGASFDYFDSLSHTASPDVPLQARANRMLLKAVMEEAGFKNYEAEWWHFT